MTSEKRAPKFHTVTCHYPDLGSASDWSCRVGNLIQPIRRTAQIWVVTHHHGISVCVCQTSLILMGKPVVLSITKCPLFSQANLAVRFIILYIFLSLSVMKGEEGKEKRLTTWRFNCSALIILIIINK